MPTARQKHSQNSDKVILEWQVHLAKQYPQKLAFTIFAIAVAASSAYYIVNPLAGIAVVPVMFFSLADFLFPVKYQLTESGAECKMLIKSAFIEWEKVRQCYYDDAGIKLSPLNTASPLEPFRGVYLRFADNGDEVIDLVKKLRGKAK